MSPASASASASAAPFSMDAQTFVARVGQAPNLPAFARHVRDIASLTGDPDARVTELERTITTDLALSAKMLRVANTLGASAGEHPGAAAGSVRQAVMLLGYDRVQHLAQATRVFDPLDRETAVTRDLMAEAALSAAHCRTLAITAGCDAPELAYLCGLFRRLGEVLVSCYASAPYQRWIEGARRGGELGERAERRHFGFTFDDVGQSLASAWGIPAAVARRMRPCPELTANADVLHLVTHTGADLARVLHGSVPTTARLIDLRATTISSLGIDGEDFDRLLRAVAQDMRGTLGQMSVDVTRWMARHAAQCHALQGPADPSASAGTSSGAPVRRSRQRTSGREGILQQLTPQADDTPAEAVLREQVRRVVAARGDAAEGGNVGASSLAALEAVCVNGFTRGVLGIITDDRTLIRGRVGIGREGTALARSFIVRPTAASGPLGAALQRQEDLVVFAIDEDHREFLRDRLLRELRPSQFALLPLVVDERLIGCLYFEGDPTIAPPSPAACAMLGVLRDHLADVLAARVRGTDADGRPANGDRAA